jgi:GntR family transcriptional regulator
VIQFSLDGRSGVSPYLQLVQQVRQAMRLGLLREGDRLPTVKDVVADLAINPNTVSKAYRELELAGLAAHEPLRRELARWLAKARRAGLDEESIEALFASTFRASAAQDIA